MNKTINIKLESELLQSLIETKIQSLSSESSTITDEEINEEAKLSILKSSYIFVTNGKKYLQSILSYTYCCSEVYIGGIPTGGIFGGRSNSSENSVANSPTRGGIGELIGDFGDNTQQPGLPGDLGEREPIDSQTQEPTDDVGGLSFNNWIKTSGELAKLKGPFKDYSSVTYNNFSLVSAYDLITKEIETKKTRFRIETPDRKYSYLYSLLVNISDDDNLYIELSNNTYTAAHPDWTINGKESSSDANLRMYLNYKKINSTYTIAGTSTESSGGYVKRDFFRNYKVTDKKNEDINKYDTTYGNGTHVLCYTTNPDDGSIEKFINDEWEYVKNSEHHRGNTKNVFAGRKTNFEGDDISARSTIYQIPATELKNNNTVVLHYDGKYVTEKNPYVIPENESSKNEGTQVTYTKYVDSVSGEVTDNELFGTSYQYSYHYSPTLDTDSDNPTHRIMHVVKVSDIVNYTTVKSSVEQHKQWTKTIEGEKIDYSLSYEWAEKEINGNVYCVASYMYTYSFKGIDFKQEIDYLSYALQENVGVVFLDDGGQLTPVVEEIEYQTEGENEEEAVVRGISILDYENYNKVESTNIGNEHPYYKIQFSDDGLRSVSNVVIFDNYKEVNVNTSKNLFYLNIIQKIGTDNDKSDSGKSYIPKIITSYDMKYYQTFSAENETGWVFAFERIDKEVTQSKICIGVPRTTIDSYEDDDIRSKYDIQINILYTSDETEEGGKQEEQKTAETTTVSEIKQASNVVDFVSINSPIITSNTKYFYTDDMYNRTGHIYTYVTPITTSSGIEYFGVRAKKKSNSSFNNTNLAYEKNNEGAIVPPKLHDFGFGTFYCGYNLPAKVIQLNDTKSIEYIYSFKNGQQYVTIDKDWKYKELFPSKISSYEFVLLGKDAPEYYTTFTTATNVAANPNVSSIFDVYDNGLVKEEYSSYYITVSFVENAIASNTFKEIKNSKSFERSVGTVYESDYEQVDPSNTEFLNNKHISLYNKQFSYIEIHSSQLDYDYIHSLTSNDELYKRDSYNNAYNGYKKYSVAELNRLSTNNRLYERYITYKEITNTSNNISVGNVFVKKYDYVEVSDKNSEPTQSIYYVKRPNTNYTYIKQGVGIVTDDSVQYYTYTYSLIDEKDLLEYKNQQIGGVVYVEQPCRKVTQDEFETLRKDSTTFYVKELEKDTIDLSTATLVDNLDLTGNTIYLDATDTAINIDTLKDKVSKQVEIASEGLTTPAEVQTRKNLTKQGKITGETSFSATNIAKRILKLNPKYVAKDVKEWQSNLYIKEKTYVSIQSSYISVGSNQKYYAFCIDKVSPSKIKSLDGHNDVFIDASEIWPDCSTVFTTSTGWGLYENPVTHKIVTLARINKYGFVVHNDAKYFERTEKAIVTKDVFLHSGKVYYKKEANQKDTYLSEQIQLTHTSYNGTKIVFDSEYNKYNNYECLWDTVKYFQATKKIYHIGDESYKRAGDIPKNLASDELIKTEFLYTTYTINDDISKSKSGSYYTNIYVFDKNNGSINKTLYLDQHVVNVDKYTYTLDSVNRVKVETDTVIQNVSPANYSDYWISFDGAEQEYQLNEYSDSPTYYFSLPTYTLYVDTHTTKEYEYRCTSEIGTYQYFNGLTYSPKVCVVDDNVFGIISYHYDISKNYSGTVEIDGVEHVSSYNLFDLEVVKLYEFSKNNLGNIVQDMSTTSNVLSSSIPFVLSNETTYTTTGSYLWHNPVHEYKIHNFGNSSYDFVDVEVSAGYWTNEYKRNVVPLQIASYTFYPNVNEVSNVSATYSFIPNSYVLTANIEYPEISYKTINVISEEHIYYTYMYNGVEQYYNFNSKIQCNKDGTYTGLIKQKIFDEEGLSFVSVLSPIKLTQHKSIIKNSNVTNIVEQEHRNDTKWFAYKTSLALTNEKVPVLYNTELMPATTKEIKYWDEETSSYETKTVIASYAYYSYQYMYDTIPLKVASYLYQSSYLTIDNFDALGYYIETVSYVLSEATKEQTKEFNKWTSYYKIAENSKRDALNRTYQLLSSYIKDGFVDLSTRVENAGQKITNALDSTSNNIVSITKETSNNLISTLSSYSYGVISSIDAMNNNIVDEIESHKTYLTTSIDTLTSYVKNIIIGEDIELAKTSDIVTYNDTVVSYMFNAERTLDSLSDLLMKSFVSTDVTTYSYTDRYGYVHNIINYTYLGLGDILRRIQVAQAVPTKNEFIVDLSQKMFANTDFDTEIVDEVITDENGNIVEKKTHKKNPVETAKKIIYRAGILWEELAKAGYCKDDVVEQKQSKLAAIKTASKAAQNAKTSEEKTKATNDLTDALSTKINK